MGNMNIFDKLKGSSICIYDIETRTFGKPDPSKDELRLFGCYSFKADKYWLLNDKDKIQKVIDMHDFLVGFNNVGTKDNPGYDNTILEREGFNLKYKRFIDLRSLFMKRAGVMKIKQGMLKDLLMKYSLDYITKLLKLGGDTKGKEEIDYRIFMKPVWTPQELAKIKSYTKQDIVITKALYEWVEEYFWSFRDFLHKSDVDKKHYLTHSPAVFTYNAMCKELNIDVEYSKTKTVHGAFKGGYVAYPAGEKFEDNLILFDFTSLYPNIFIQCNLFSNNCTCCTLQEKWHGNDFFKINGYYCTKTQGKIELLYKKLFLLRKQYKKEKNPKEYAIKIILNSGYGLTGNPTFKHLYNKDTSSDCTAIGRQCILYTRKRFRQEGFKNVFTDTDSVCIQYPKGRREDCINLSKQIVLELQNNMPFPW